METKEMQKFTVRLFAAIAVLWLGSTLAIRLQAQNLAPTFTITSTAAAVDNSNQSINVTSGTGITGNALGNGTWVKVDDELMPVLSMVPASTSGAATIRVQRGGSGSRATRHGNGAVIYIASNAAAFNACNGGPPNSTGCGSLNNSGNVTRYSAGLFYPTLHATVLTTAGALTYTPGQVLSGLIVRAGNGSARTDTLPTAVLLVAAIPGATVGTTIELTVVNNSATNVAITLAAGTGGTLFSGLTAAIPQVNAERLLIVLTAVNSGSEAYTVYPGGALGAY